MSFNPLAAPGAIDFGLLYVGVADGGSGGDPLGVGQNLGVPYGKILRIDPLGSDSANGQYGIPAGNPFVSDSDAGTLGEIYAYGVRNPQRFGWDPLNRNLFLADIGQNIVEELSLVPAGGNLGWNAWEGSFGFVSRQAVSLTNQRGDPAPSIRLSSTGRSTRCSRTSPRSPACMSTAATRSRNWRTWCCSVTSPAARSSTFRLTHCRMAGRMPSAGFCSTTTGNRRHCLS